MVLVDLCKTISGRLFDPVSYLYHFQCVCWILQVLTVKGHNKNIVFTSPISPAPIELYKIDKIGSNRALCLHPSPEHPTPMVKYMKLAHGSVPFQHSVMKLHIYPFMLESVSVSIDGVFVSAVVRRLTTTTQAAAVPVPAITSSPLEGPATEPNIGASTALGGSSQITTSRPLSLHYVLTNT